MDYYVYILQSERNNSFYKGSTDNLIARFKRHNAGLNTYTKKLIPWNLVWYTTKETRSEVRILELKLKNLSVERTIDFIIKYPAPNKIPELEITPFRAPTKPK